MLTLGQAAAAALAPAGAKTGGGPAGVVSLPGLEGVQGPPVAHHQAAGHEHGDGASPMSRHQPREMSLLAGSLMVENVRSTAVRRA